MTAVINLLSPESSGVRSLFGLHLLSVKCSAGPLAELWSPSLRKRDERALAALQVGRGDFVAAACLECLGCELGPRADPNLIWHGPMTKWQARAADIPNAFADG